MTNHSISRREFSAAVTGSLLMGMIRTSSMAEESSLPKNEFSFGVITDAQYCDAEPNGTRFYRNSPKKMEQCVAVLNQHDLDFCIHLGDFIDREFISFDTMNPIYDTLKPRHYHVLGNHDFSVAEEALDQVAGKLGMPSRYYAFRTNGYRMVVLDGNDLSLISRKKGTPKHAESQRIFDRLKKEKAVNAQTWNGAIGKSQITWLERQLSEADQANERAIVFCHFPVFPQNVHNLWNDREVVRILEAHRSVVAFLNGHNHAGEYGKKSGIHYVTFPGMVETNDTSAYAIVRVTNESLVIDGYGRSPDRKLEIRN